MINDSTLEKKLKRRDSEVVDPGRSGFPSLWNSVFSAQDPISSWLTLWDPLQSVMPVFYERICEFTVDIIPTRHVRSGNYQVLMRMAAPGRIDNLREVAPDESDEELHEFAVTESPLDVRLPEDVQGLVPDFPAEFQQLWSEVGDGLFFDIGMPLGLNPSRVMRAPDSDEVGSWDFDPRKTVVIYESTYTKLYCELSPGFPTGALLPGGKRGPVSDLWSALQRVLVNDGNFY